MAIVGRPRSAPIRRLRPPVESPLWSALCWAGGAILGIIVGLPLFLFAVLLLPVCDLIRRVLMLVARRRRRSQPADAELGGAHIGKGSIDGQRVAATEARWLPVPRPRCVLHALLMFEPSSGAVLDAAAVRCLLAERVLPRYPRFACKPTPLPLSAGGGHWWSPDPAFNLEKHVITTSCGGKGLECFVAQHLSAALPDDKPPWELYVLDKCRRANEQVPVLLRVHPALGDGQALLRVLCHALADAALPSNGVARPAYSPPPTPSTPNGRPIQIPANSNNATPSRFQLYMKLVRGAVFGPLSLLFWLAQSPRAPPSTGPSRTLNATPLSSPTPVVATPSSGSRTTDNSLDTICWSSSIPLPKLRRIQQVSRSSLHCVLLSAVAGAARVLLQGCGVRHPADVRAVLPVMPSTFNSPELANRTAPVVIALPVSVEGAVPRLWATRRCLQQLRSSAEPAAVLVWSSAAASLWPWRHLAGRLLQTLTGVGSLQFAAMAGPTAPVVVGGATLAAMYSLLPPPDDVGLSISVFTYAGQVFITVAAEQSLGTAGNFLMHQINLQVELLWRLLRHRRAPGETRAQVCVRTAAASAPIISEDVRSSPLRELASRLGVVQEELQRVRATHGDTARLKAEFTQLLREMRRRQHHRRRRRRRRTVSFSPAAPSPTPSPTPTPTPSPASDEDADSFADHSFGEEDIAKCRCVQPVSYNPVIHPRLSVATPKVRTVTQTSSEQDYYTIAEHYFPASLKNPLKFPDGSESPSPPPRLPSCLKNNKKRSRRRVTSTTSSDSSPSLSSSVLRQLKSYYDDAFIAANEQESIDLSSPSPPPARRSPVPLWFPGAQNLKYADSDSDVEPQPPIVVVDGDVQSVDNISHSGPLSPRHLSVTSIPRSYRSPRHSSGDNGFYEGSEHAEEETARQRFSSSPESAITITPSPKRLLSPFPGGNFPGETSPGETSPGKTSPGGTSPGNESTKSMPRPSTLQVKALFSGT